MSELYAHSFRFYRRTCRKKVFFPRYRDRAQVQTYLYSVICYLHPSEYQNLDFVMLLDFLYDRDEFLLESSNGARVLFAW